MRSSKTKPGQRITSLQVLLQLLPGALLAALFASVGILHVTSRVLVVDAGYRLSRLEEENRQLTLRNDRLKLELATLVSPARLEKLARDQGLQPPPAGTVISLGGPPPPPTPAQRLARAGPP
ncbi:MAG TPA: cell division protein FtsL [Myxococcaceae bacterium]|nr:cell division protein FtsL [Myxococcaceae bacterium]